MQEIEEREEKGRGSTNVLVGSQGKISLHTDMISISAIPSSPYLYSFRELFGPHQSCRLEDSISLLIASLVRSLYLHFIWSREFNVLLQYRNAYLIVIIHATLKDQRLCAARWASPSM